MPLDAAGLTHMIVGIISTFVSFALVAAAIVAAAGCRKREIGGVGPYVLLAGCAVSFLASLVFSVMGVANLAASGSMAVAVIGMGINVFGSLLMLAGLALTSPTPNAESSGAGA